MSVAYATISGQFLDVVGDAFPTAYTKSVTVGHIEAATANGLITSAGKVLFQKKPIRLDSAGNASVTLPVVPQPDIAPSDPWYKMTINVRRNQPDVVIFFQIAVDMTWDEVMSSAVGNVSPDAALVAQLNALTATIQGFARPAAQLEVFCHSYGVLGASASQYLWQNLVNRRLGATLTDRSISGSKFINGNPGTNCGYATLLQNTSPSAARTLSSKVFTPNTGLSMFLEGLNSISDSVTNTGVDTALAVSAWGHAVRNMLSRSQISALIESTAGAPITLAGSGSWATSGSTQQNSGTGYSQNSSAGATVSIAVPSDWKGGVLVLGFVANRTGGTVPASDITFTIDGTPTKPIGYPGTFTTKDVAPTNGTGAQYIVARFSLSAGTHTVVATSGTGGMAFDCIWVESEIPRPCVWGGQPKTPSATATVNAAVDLINPLSKSIVEGEFRLGVGKFVDLDPLLGANAAYFADGTHPNDLGYAIIADAMVQGWNELQVVNHQLIYA